MDLVGMKIIKNILPKQLLNACIDDFKSELGNDCWSSSNFSWAPFLKQGIHGSTMGTNVPKRFSDAIAEHLKPHAPEFNKLTCRYNIWQPGSGIGVHSDDHHIFGATIYLNDNWHPNAGGWFVWMDHSDLNLEDDPNKTDVFRAVLPEKNMLVLNDMQESHLVTTVAHDVPEFRFTIQIWGDL